jgi:hypothetical protein
MLLTISTALEETNFVASQTTWNSFEKSHAALFFCNHITHKKRNNFLPKRFQIKKECSCCVGKSSKAPCHFPSHFAPQHLQNSLFLTPASFQDNLRGDKFLRTPGRFPIA